MPHRLVPSSLGAFSNHTQGETLRRIVNVHKRKCEQCHGFNIIKRHWRDVQRERSGVSNPIECPVLSAYLKMELEKSELFGPVKTEVERFWSETVSERHSPAKTILDIMVENSMWTSLHGTLVTYQINTIKPRWMSNTTSFITGILRRIFPEPIYLNELLESCSNVTTIDVMNVKPTSENMKSIGQCCVNLRVLLNLDLVSCNLQAVHFLLFTNIDRRIKNALCQHLRILSYKRPFHVLSYEERQQYLSKLFYVVIACRNISHLGSEHPNFSVGEILVKLYDVIQYQNTQVTALSFYSQKKKDFHTLINIYRNQLTELKVQNYIIDSALLDQFDHLSTLHLGRCRYAEHVKPFLESKGSLLSILKLRDEFEDSFLDVNEIIKLCQNVIELSVRSKNIIITDVLTRETAVERFEIDFETERLQEWVVKLSCLLGRMENIKILTLGARVSRSLTDDLVTRHFQIQNNCIRSLKTLKMEHTGLLSASGMQDLIVSCGELKELGLKTRRIDPHSPFASAVKNLQSLNYELRAFKY